MNNILKNIIVGTAEAAVVGTVAFFTGKHIGKKAAEKAAIDEAGTILANAKAKTLADNAEKANNESDKDSNKAE